jgi:hypothetical protein
LALIDQLLRFGELGLRSQHHLIIARDLRRPEQHGPHAV